MDGKISIFILHIWVKVNSNHICSHFFFPEKKDKRLHHEKSNTFIVGGPAPHDLESDLEEKEGKNSFSYR